MSTLFPSPMTVEKITISLNNIGEYVPTSEEVTFSGSIQPISAHEILALNIGRMDVGKIKIYSDSKLFVSKSGTDKSGDLVKWSGKLYEIIMENKYVNGLIEHYKYFAEYRDDGYQGVTV